MSHPAGVEVFRYPRRLGDADAGPEASSSDSFALSEDHHIRLSSDYNAEYSLWACCGEVDPADLGLSRDLTTALQSWQEQFDTHFHWETGWDSAGAADAYRSAGPQLLVALQAELGPDFVVTLQL